MKRALRLAVKARGRTSPNPMVGAVVVQNERIVGQGYHHRAGNPHAEIVALQKAGTRTRGATLYVTLEPCCHVSKRTPPCVPAIRYSGIQRVVVAMRDPNPKVRGKGIRQLRQTGIDVDVGCLEREAQELNQAYQHWILTGYPFVILKGAMTLDGKIATATGESKWITGEESRRHVHQLRSHVDAILIGIDTVLKDDPSLSVRGDTRLQRAKNLRQPVRVVLDSRLRIPQKAKILRWALEQPTIVCTTSRASQTKMERLRKSHVSVLVFPHQYGQVSLSACFRKLGQMGITSLLVEGGAQVNASVLEGGFASQVQLYMAPMLLGGADSVSLIGGQSPQRLAHAKSVENIKIQRIGRDIILTGTCLNSHHRRPR